MSFIDVTRSGAVGIVTFNRPEMRNAFTIDMYRDCCVALREFEKDDTINAVVLAAEGKDFCTGNDLNEFVNAGTKLDLENILDREKVPSTDMVHVVANYPKPIVAALKGRAIGWGSTMLLICDMVVAEEDAEMFFKFVRMGLVPEGGATKTLRDRVGTARASKILLSGGSIKMPEAQETGLVVDVVPVGDANASALALAEQIAANPPKAVQATKRLIQQETTTISEKVDAEFTEFAKRLVDPESQEIFAALLRR